MIDQATRFRQMRDILELKNVSEEFSLNWFQSIKKSMSFDELSERLNLMRKRYNLFLTMMCKDYGLNINGIYEKLDEAWEQSLKGEEDTLIADIVQYNKKGPTKYIKQNIIMSLIHGIEISTAPITLTVEFFTKSQVPKEFWNSYKKKVLTIIDNRVEIQLQEEKKTSQLIPQ